ncbi:TonB-dependent receptor domain-containing protein [Terracidiphilus sp.]|uniref:TonB-dependent receptor n=1 Tax=Terracidiphilus sp. TaxID=1964191 RepID=UPI003C1C143B
MSLYCSHTFSHKPARVSALLSILLLTLFLAGGASKLYSQGITTGGISGTVVDPKGAVIPGAQIKVIDIATGGIYTQTSRSDGEFNVLTLPIGKYKLSITAPGFEVLTVNDLTIDVGTLSLGTEALKIGQGVETVEASAIAPLLNTEESQLGVTLESEQLENLPFGGGFDTAALLTPGVAITHANSFSNNNGAYGGFSSQGQRGRANNFEIDGQSNNDNSVAGPQVFFANQDALAGVEVITNNFSAEYGRNAGSVVNYLTKSGTNKFHGSAFEFYEGNWGESFAQGQKSPFLGYCASGQNPTTTGCVVPTLPRYVDNVFGYTIGGPVWRDKLWFFSSGLWNRFRNGGGTSLSGPSTLTPDPTGLTELQAAFPNDPGVAAEVNSGPYSIKTGNPRPVGTPVQVPVTDASGNSATIEMAEIGRSVPSLTNDEELLERADWQPTSKDHAFLRFFYQNDPVLNAGGSVVAGAWYNVPDTAYSVGADWSRTFTPSLVNQLRYSFQQTAVLFEAGGQPGCVWTTPENCTASIGINGNVSANQTAFTILGFGYPTNIPQGRTVKVTQAQDNLTWTKGKQTILIGGEWDYQNSPNPFVPDWNGGFSFNPATIGAGTPVTGFGTFLSGQGQLSIANANGFTTKFTEQDASAYFQDDWKVTPTLTLNLGVRWEFFGQAINLLHNETVARETNPSTAFWDMSLPLYVRTAASAPNHWKQYQPRLGLAFNPAFDRKLVVRAGFSMNFDPAFYNMFLNVATSAPVINLGNISGCGISVQCLPSGGATGSLVRAQALQYLPVGPTQDPGARSVTTTSPNFHDPYTESWLFGFSHQIGSKAVLEIDYVGNHQVGNFQSQNSNPYLAVLQQYYPTQAPVTLCSTAGAVGQGNLDCNRSVVSSFTNGAFAVFNSLESKITTKSWHGLTSTTSFTYSKTIDNSSEVYSTGGGGNTIAYAENPLNPNEPERGVSGDSYKYIASSGFDYVLPGYRSGLGLLGRALSGYRLDTIWTLNTGQPLSLYQTGFFGNNPQDGPYDPTGPGPAWESYSDQAFSNAMVGADTIRPIMGNPKAPMNSVAVIDNGSICGTAGAYVNYAQYNAGNCVTGSPSSFHWIRNTAYANAALGQTPYTTVGRNNIRGQAWNNFDATLQKVTRLSERLTMTLSLIDYNALNRQYLGSPTSFIDDAGSSFMDFRYNYGSNRNTQLKVQFQF